MANEWEVVREDPWAVVSEEGEPSKSLEIGRALAHAGADVVDAPAAVAGMPHPLDISKNMTFLPEFLRKPIPGTQWLANLLRGDPEGVDMSKAPGFLPQGAQDVLNKTAIPEGATSRALSNVVAEPETLLGKGTRIAAPFLLPFLPKGANLIPKAGRGAINFMDRVNNPAIRAEQIAVKKAAKSFIKEGKRADTVRKMMGLDDMTQHANFDTLFPNMAKAGAKNADEALKKGSAIYTDAKNSEAFARTQLHPTQDYVGGLRRLQVTEDLPKGMAKQLSDNLEGISVADRFHLVQDVRDVARKAAKSGDLVKSGQFSKIDDLLQRMEPVAGTDKAVIEKIAKADALYAEGMSLKRVEDAVKAASMKGSSKGLTLSGSPTVRAQDVLDGLQKLGPQARKTIPNYAEVEKVLQEAMRRGGELSKAQQSRLTGLLGTVVDWRILAALGTGAVGTSVYHQGKTIKALIEGR